MGFTDGGPSPFERPTRAGTGTTLPWYIEVARPPGQLAEKNGRDLGMANSNYMVSLLGKLRSNITLV